MRLYTQQLRRSAFVSIVTLFAFGVGTPQLSARQIDTVVYVHGLQQGGSAWNFVASHISSVYTNIHAHKPTLGWESTYNQQANILRNGINSLALDDAAAVTHSNGGVVARQYLLNEQQQSRLNRVLTLGTPHRGAELARRLLDGSVFAWAANGLGKIVSTFGYYVVEDPDFYNLTIGGGPGGFHYESLALTLGEFFEPPIFGAGLTGIGFLASAAWDYPDNLDQLRPDHGTWTILNHPTNLSAEATVTTDRVSIATDYPKSLMPWGLFVWNPTTFEAYRQELMWFCQQAAQYYASHWDSGLRNNAWRWDDLYGWLLLIPNNWELFTGALFDRSDGVVPWSSARYPGGTSVIEIPYQTSWVPHNQQLIPIANPMNDPFLTSVRQVLAVEFGLDNPPPPPLTASISGPSVVAAGQFNNWNGSANGGQPPYSYSWSGQLSGSGQVVSGALFSSGYLYLTVTSADGQQKMVPKHITVTGGGGPCPTCF